MITKGKMPWSFIKFSQVILKKIYGDQFGEFVCGYWGLKGQPEIKFDLQHVYCTVCVLIHWKIFNCLVLFKVAWIYL